MKIYEINPNYIEYLLPFAPHLFRNKAKNQVNERKYVGVVLHIHNMDYFAPLSSYKEKHAKMKDGLDFLKIKDYAVINLNNMFPVPDGVYTYVDFNNVRDVRYKMLLQAEYRALKSLADKIRKNAQTLYQYKLNHQNDTPLAKRCNDFLLLEEKCAAYRPSSAKQH